MKELIVMAYSKAVKLIKDTYYKLFKLVKSILYYTRINDECNRVSLTNLAMIIVMYKMLITHATSWQDLTALSIAILGYQVKRIIEKEKDK